MSMTWGLIRKYYLQACGEATAAADEAWDHLTEGHRRVLSSVDVPDLYKKTAYTVLSGNDFVALAVDVYHLSTVFNVTLGQHMREEPGGMVGRDLFLQQTTGKPQPGPLTHWWRDGANLYVRGTAQADTTLQVRYMVQVPALSDSDINGMPVTPDQYDWAIVHAAAMNYLSVHPADNTVLNPERNITRLGQIQAAFASAIQIPKASFTEENKNRQENMRMPGYFVTPRSRMGG